MNGIRTFFLKAHDPALGTALYLPGKQFWAQDTSKEALTVHVPERRGHYTAHDPALAQALGVTPSRPCEIMFELPQVNARIDLHVHTPPAPHGPQLKAVCLPFSQPELRLSDDGGQVLILRLDAPACSPREREIVIRLITEQHSLSLRNAELHALIADGRGPRGGQITPRHSRARLSLKRRHDGQTRLTIEDRGVTQHLHLHLSTTRLTRFNHLLRTWPDKLNTPL